MTAPKQVDALSVVGLWQRVKNHCSDSTSALFAAWRRWQRDDASSLAAAVSYYMALSLFPILLLLTGGLGLILRYSKMGNNAHDQILLVVSEHCSPALEAKVQHVLDQFEAQSLANGPIGVLATLLAAIGVFYQFERAFDKIWRIPPAAHKGWVNAITTILRSRLSAFLLLSGVGGMILMVFSVNLFVAALSRWISNFNATAAILLTSFDSAITLLLNAISFAILYRWLPKRPVAWSAAARGGVLVAGFWEIGRQLLSAFVIGMRYSTAYGAIGSFISLLLWFYWGMMLLLFGAEYVLVLSRRSAKQRNLLDPPAPKAKQIHSIFSRRFVQLKTTSRRTAA